MSVNELLEFIKEFNCTSYKITDKNGVVTKYVKEGKDAIHPNKKQS